ncbi:dehydrogenase [Rhodopirellula sp. SM50]|nr:SGNH/GDSL hydrolase family protein [Rhodopirellula sp. SM50]PAY20936.1 dehydrogenase [Rhodopirellula sp. SM50]
MKHISIVAILLGGLTLSVASAESPIRPGDRIAIVGNTFADQLRIHGYLETALLQHAKGISIRNLGWGGDMLAARDRPTNFPSEESTLRDHNTDVIIACFGMGESFGGIEALDQFRRDLESFIASHAGKQYNGESEVRLILVSPIACEDLGKLTPDRDARNDVLRAYTEAANAVASAADTPFVNLFETSLYLMDEPVGPNLTTNGIHLNRFGYWAISHEFASQLLASDQPDHFRPWRITIDARTKTGQGRGVEVSELTVDVFQADDPELTFRGTETSAPRLPPPTDQPLPPPLAFHRDTIVVQHLPAGTYQLTIDGEHVATAAADAWGQGIAIDHSPAHRDAERYRADVNDKNLQFTYSWKALNQVHIVGERKRSPSGRALPGEVIEFNRLANQRDEALQGGPPLKSRQWRLARVER